MTMLRDIGLVVDGRLDSTDHRVGVLAGDIPTGHPMPAFLLNDIDVAFPNRLYSMEILTQPQMGRLYLDKTGAGTFTGVPADTYTGTQRVDKYDPGIGLVSSTTGIYTIQIGEAVASVTGVTVSPGSATGSQQFSASVQGENGPSQAVTWERDGAGTISGTGYFTEPPKTAQVQVITIRARSVADPSVYGLATVTIATDTAVPQPTVTGVTLSPTAAVVEAETQQFTWVVTGTNNPPQTVTLTTNLGTISASGLLTRPARTAQEQTGTVTAASTLDPNVKDTATFTIPAESVVEQPPEARTVSLILGEAYGPAANLRNLMVGVYAASGPHATGAAIYQSATESTDEYGVLSFALNSEQVSLGDIVLLAVLAPDGRHYLGLVTVE